MTDYKNRLETLLADLNTELKAIGIHDPHNPADWIAVPESVDAMKGKRSSQHSNDSGMTLRVHSKKLLREHSVSVK
jgi:hypothetical protein